MNSQMFAPNTLILFSLIISFYGLNVEKEKTNASPIEALYFKAGLKIKQNSCKNWDLT
jgi:hypothetical protein